MSVYDRAADALRKRGISKAEVGRKLGVTGQSVTLKLQGKRPVTVEELSVIAEMAGTTVAALLGDDAVILEDDDELALIEAYRQTGDAQRQMLRQMLAELTRGKKQPGNED